MQTHQAAASLETIQVLALFTQRCALRTAHGIICRYNWIADYAIIMLVHVNSPNKQEALGQ